MVYESKLHSYKYMAYDQISMAINLLRQNKPIAFPTDTVYGLGADPSSEFAIRSIFQLKNRPTTQALPVLLPDIGHIYDWIDQDHLRNSFLKKQLFNLLEKFWPGPLTVILKKSAKVSSLLTAGKDSIAIRVPNHPLTLKLLKTFNSGIIGSSANKSGEKVSTTYDQVKKAFHDKVFVLDGSGFDIMGVESTILSLINKPTIIREGAIGATVLKQYL